MADMMPRNMELSRALLYIFEDNRWVSKLVLLATMLLLGLIPIFGLLAWALALGFLLQVATNVRHGLPRPLPAWNDWEEKFRIGGQLLSAMLVYNLPGLLMISCAGWILSGLLGNNYFGTLFLSIFWSVLLVIGVGYIFITWTLLGVGVTEFIDTGNPRSLFRVVHLLDVAQAQSSIVLTWALYTSLINVLALILLAVPCVGWLLAGLFVVPAQGHILGQFAQQLGTFNRVRRST